jgi:hypothetical protein
MADLIHASTITQKIIVLDQILNQVTELTILRMEELEVNGRQGESICEN